MTQCEHMQKCNTTYTSTYSSLNQKGRSLNKPPWAKELIMVFLSNPMFVARIHNENYGILTLWPGFTESGYFQDTTDEQLW